MKTENKIFFRLALLLICLFINSACSVKNLQRQSLPGEIYQIRKGDTLSEISRRYQISIDEIVETNGIKNYRTIGVGDYLFLPTLSKEQPVNDKKYAPPKKVGRSKVAQKDNKKIKNKVTKDDGVKIDLVMPVKKGVIVQKFDETPESLFEGIGINAHKGTPVLAAANGTVIYVNENVDRFGRMVIVKHANHFVSIYAHLEKIIVADKAVVKVGDVLGAVGTSGGVETPRLFFQLRKNRLPVDPERYLGKR